MLPWIVRASTEDWTFHLVTAIISLQKGNSNEFVDYDTNAFDFRLNMIAALYELLWVPEATDSRGCSSQNDISGMQRHHSGNVGDCGFQKGMSRARTCIIKHED